MDSFEPLKLFRSLSEVSLVIMSPLKLRTCSGFLFITVPRGASIGWIIGYAFIMYFEFTNLVRIRAETPGAAFYWTGSLDAHQLWMLLNIRNIGLDLGWALIMDAFDSKKLFRILAEVSRGAYNWIGRALHQ
jgi:hypothetical protein